MTSTIKASLQDAYVDGYIERDIYSRVKAVSSKKTAQFQNYLEADEFERLQRYLYATVTKSDQFHLLVLLALETGARLGELLALTRPDFTGNAIDINKSYSNSVKAVTLPKNKSSIRTITLSTRMSEVLEWYIKQNNNNDLFPHWSNQTIQNNLVRILKEAHSHPIKFHGLRHSHVSYLLHNGVDITYISKRVGHSNTAITIQVYSHMLKEKEQVQNELALNILDNLGKNT
ncbi:site-specific integrase [Leuconostoc pseudomesenteroides]|uniref:tyrosine-type recombinase/integrase n=1 Tax=Leuconostoc pseudomesenteroides TaxID=33968 RepID=UPI00403D7BA5